MHEENEKVINFCSSRYSIWPVSLFMDEEMGEIDDRREDNRNDNPAGSCGHKSCQKGRCPVFLPRKKDAQLNDGKKQVLLDEEAATIAAKDSQDTVECCAIVTPTVMRGMLLTYASNLKRPVVVLERKPEQCKIYQHCSACTSELRHTACENTENFIRLESTAFYDWPMSACAWIRKTQGQTFCNAFDAGISDWFLKMAENGFVDEFGNELKDEGGVGDLVDIPFDFIGKKRWRVKAKLRIIKNGNMQPLRILSYTCPLSGYTETSVLIDCMGIHGVIIAGQTIFKGSDNVEICDNYRAQVGDELYGKSEWNCLNEDEKTMVDRIVYKRMENQTTSEADFLEDVGKMANRFLADLELRYYRRVEARKQLLISRVAREFHAEVRELFNTYSQTDHLRQGEPSRIENKKYEYIQQKFKDMICERLPTKYGFVEPGVEDYLQFDFSKGSIEIAPVQFGLPSENKIGTVDTKVATATLGEAAVIETGPHIFSCNYTAMQDINELIEIKISNAVDSSRRCTGNENDYRIMLIKQILEAIFEQFERVAAQIRAEYHRKKNVTFTKSMRHELGQIYDGNLQTLSRYRDRFERDKKMLEDKVKRELSRIEVPSKKDKRDREIRESFQERERQLRMENITHLLRNFGGYMHASVMRVRSTEFMDLFPPPKPIWFYPYEAFLWKWREIYDHIADRHQFQFTLHSPDNKDAFDYTRPRMFADANQVEQVAYNLTNNAFKYAHDGTVIDVDCRVCQKNERYKNCDSCAITSGRYLFKVENFGFALSKVEQEQLGEYGFRGSNSPIGIDGTGLGIWYCKGIATSHNGHLIIDYSPVSQYSFTSMLIYSHLSNDSDKERMFQQAKETWEIRMIEAQKNGVTQPAAFPFADVSDMGEKVDRELTCLKSLQELRWDDLVKKFVEKSLIWNEKAENFSLQNPRLACAFAGESILRGTAKYVIGVCMPIEYKKSN